MDRLALFDLSDRTKLRFVGPQALWFLDQLLTNKVDELPPGSGAEALLLTPNGRITSHLRVLHLPDSGDGPDVLVDAPAGHAQLLLDFFAMRIFATRVTIADVSDEFAVIRVIGPEAVQAVARAWDVKTLQAEEHANNRFSLEGGEGLVVRVNHGSPGLDLWIPADAKDAIIAGLAGAGATRLSEEDYDALRIAAGIPAIGIDFNETYLPQEAALEKSVHFAKGCYLGQEAVAMAQRGRVKRRLRHLEFQGQGHTGTVNYEDTEAGHVTSAASSNGVWFGIGTVKTDVPVGQTVSVVAGEQPGDSPAVAVVKELPGTTSGPRVPSARELREQLQGR